MVEVLGLIKPLLKTIKFIIKAVEQVKVNKNACKIIKNRVEILSPLVKKFNESTDINGIERLRACIFDAQKFVEDALDRGYMWWLYNRKKREDWFSSLDSQLLTCCRDLQLELIIDISQRVQGNSHALTMDALDLENWLTKNNDKILQSIDVIKNKARDDTQSILNSNQEMINEMKKYFNDQLSQPNVSGEVWLKKQQDDVSQSYQKVKEILTTLSPDYEIKPKLPSKFVRVLSFIYYGRTDKAIQYQLIKQAMTKDLASVKDLKKFHINDLQTAFSLVEDCFSIIHNHLVNLTKNHLESIRRLLEQAMILTTNVFSSLKNDFEVIPEILLSTQIRLISLAYLFDQYSLEPALKAFRQLILSPPIYEILDVEFGKGVGFFKKDHYETRRKVLKDIYKMMNVLKNWSSNAESNPTTKEPIEEKKDSMVENLMSFSIISQQNDYSEYPIFIQKILELENSFLYTAPSIVQNNKATMNHCGVVSSIDFHKNYIFSSSFDKTVRRFDIDKNYNSKVMSGHSCEVNVIIVNNDYVYSASTDHTIRKWDIDTGKCIHTFSAGDFPVQFIAFFQNFMWSASTLDNDITKWDVETGDNLGLLKGHTNVISKLLFHEKYLFSGSFDCSVRKWDTISNKCLMIYKHHFGRISFILIQDNLLYAASEDCNISQIDIQKGACIKFYKGHKSIVNFLLIHQKLLFSCSDDSYIRKWDIETGHCLSILTGHTSPVKCLTLYSNTLFSGSYDTTIRAWDIKTDQNMAIFNGHKTASNNLTIYNGNLYSTSCDHTLRVWDIL